MHLCDPAQLRYAWHAQAPSLARPYLLPDYLESAKGRCIKGLVFLECDCDREQRHLEVQMVTAWAREQIRFHLRFTADMGIDSD